MYLDVLFPCFSSTDDAVLIKNLCRVYVILILQKYSKQVYIQHPRHYHYCTRCLSSSTIQTVCWQIQEGRTKPRGSPWNSTWIEGGTRSTGGSVKRSTGICASAYKSRGTRAVHLALCRGPCNPIGALYCRANFANQSHPHIAMCSAAFRPLHTALEKHKQTNK